MDDRNDTLHDLERILEKRAQFRLRHAVALTTLMEERADLRGVHALADHFDDAVRWTA
jgi:site-specific recombinase XerD